MAEKFTYETCCVYSDADSINDMVDSARDITLGTFKRRCEVSEFFSDMGYGKDLRIEKDWYVKFYKSKYQGKPCYFMVHSAIEYIFTKN